jgi:hypothetical protein
MPSSGLAITSSALMLGLAAPSAPPASPLERSYLSKRDEYVRRFEKTGADVGPHEDRHALDELEKLLRAIVGPVKLAGLAGPGTINLETLQHDGGFGQADGLRFDWGGDDLFVTSRPVLDCYLTMHGDLPRDLVELSRTDEIYSLILNWNAAFYRFTDIPVTHDGSITVAQASITLPAQDIGPWPPTTVLVFVERGHRVFVVRSELKDQLPQMPVCEAKWNEFERKYTDALRAAHRPGGSTAKDPSRYEQEGYDAYRRCYGRAIRDHASFAAVTRRAQAIVDRLRGDEARGPGGR